MSRLAPTLLLLISVFSHSAFADDDSGSVFFERHVRPILVKHCYECHSEEAQTREGGLLLDRESGWLAGGDSGKAVVPNNANASLLITAILYDNEDLQMPPENKLSERDIKILQRWIQTGAAGPKTDMGTTEFSRLGDQEYLGEKAATHWAYQPIIQVEPPEADDDVWNRAAIDRFVYARLSENGLTPSRQADYRTLLRRLHYDLTGLPPTSDEVHQFKLAVAKDRATAVHNKVDELLESPAFGEHVARMWLDVARYADTDSAYRPDTKTPYYFPFAFTYRDYVIDSFNADKPFDQFVKEQLAADLMGFEKTSPETAALGFLTVGPHAHRNQEESIDDLIDLTTRGLMGVTVACARCHDHKYEAVPTTDYYALRGVFTSVTRLKELDEKKLPVLAHYVPSKADVADFLKQRAPIDKKIKGAAGKVAKNNRRAVDQKIRETELAKLLTFHPGAPVHTMIVAENKRPIDSPVFIRGDARNRGDVVPRRFLTLLDAKQKPFPKNNSGRLALAEHIVNPTNPLTARVFVNRVWGMLIGAHLVDTPSDFGLQGTPPTHPKLLDWLAADFIASGWSTKHLVKTIVMTQTYQQRSRHRSDAADVDSQNVLLWRANRKHLSIEAIRDTILAAAGQLDRTIGGKAAPLWDDDYSKRRAIYGYVNRFNLDPTLRAFDFPSRMQTTSGRGESIVAPQALFTLNSPFVVDQAVAITELSEFKAASTDADRITAIFAAILQRAPAEQETDRIIRFIEQQTKLFKAPKKNSKVTNPWPLVTQAILMSNELQYVD